MQATLPFDPPPTMTRREVIALVTETGRCMGLTPACLRVLAKMVASTTDRDWSHPDAVPMFFGKQDRLADQVGITERQVRTHEGRLVRIGCVERSPLGNGHRHASSRTGLSLGPLKDRLGELAARRSSLRVEHERKRDLKAERCAARRRIVDLTRTLSPDDRTRPAVVGTLALVARWPRTDRLMSMKGDALEHHVAEAVRAVAALEADLGAPRTAPDPAQTSLDIPRLDRALVSASNTLSKLGDLMRPSRLITLASAEFRAAALALGEPTEVSMMAAAETRRSELEVGPGAWEEAIATFGREAATVVLLVVDANRTRHPNPVRRPGAALQGIVRKAAVGTFNLPGAVIALDRRRRLEMERRAA